MMNRQTFNLRILFRFTLLLVAGLMFTDQAFAKCTAASKYCNRQGQRTNTNQSKPLAASKVPEASNGFQHPLNAVRYSTNKNGNDFAQKDAVSYPNCGTIYHPGLDLNWGSGNQDCGSAIGSIADGVVVWIGTNSEWQGIMVQHKYQGEMVLAAYGHVVEIDPNLSVGDTVKKNQFLARVGSVGADYCHLHIEIRKLSSHPNPMNGRFFCDNTTEKKVKDWYYSPEPFIDSHYAYSTRPNISLLAPSSPVSRMGFNTYEFTVGVEERDGQSVNIDWVYIDGMQYSGQSFFGTSKLKARGSLTKKVRLERWLWREQTIPYTIKVLNNGRWETWTKLITLRRSW
ncbi:MAG: M23 family metallopeptidase [Pyrinomonadaceae bacterium]|nr:M23 family metallopeptidase [Pyrinomonadaceae bacterium]